ncbi:hypothetical protein BDZ45DRAFT_192280 [Acephala macrosclerotiorum]|nr:hypothetical protein BDZ45DRAFT_192280 [Acephala macrosclerotiorum]
MVQLLHQLEQGSTPGQICEYIFFELDHAPERFFFDLSRIRHFAVSMETGLIPVRAEGAFRRLRRARKAETSSSLAKWSSTFLEHIHENLSEELQSFTLVFDATRQTEKRPRYGCYSPARNFSVLDVSSSRVLFDILEEVETTLHNPHDVNPLGATPSVLQACNCWKEPELKIRLGTVVRDSLRAKRTARVTSRSLNTTREN